MEKKKPRILENDKYYPVYMNQYDNKVTTCSIDIFDKLALILGQMENFNDMLNKIYDDEDFNEDAWCNSSALSDAIIRDSQRRLADIRKLFEEQVGTVDIHYPMVGEQGCLEELPLGMKFNPVS